MLLWDSRRYGNFSPNSLVSVAFFYFTLQNSDTLSNRELRAVTDWLGRPNCSGFRHGSRQALRSSASCSSPVCSMGAPNVGKSSGSVSDQRSGCLQILLSAVAERRGGYVMAPGCHCPPGGISLHWHIRLSCSQEGRWWAPSCPTVGRDVPRRGRKDSGRWSFV